ncbi:hypothetical protein BS78_07G100300 [Paspalum vaginatum]|nr:hypothetical protein BS78_07G100300 [Paspalum vaginatum]
MKPWKELQPDTVPGTLLTVAVDTTGRLIRLVGTAHRILTAFAQEMRSVRAGTPATKLRILARAHGKFGAPGHVPSPSSVLDGAIRELARLSALHLKAGVRARNNLDLRHPLLQAWMGHRRDALAHARDAKRKLRSAASAARAFEDALGRLRGTCARGRGSPTWTAAMSALLRLAHNAVVATALALRALRRMRDAVALEFRDACRVLNS